MVGKQSVNLEHPDTMRSMRIFEQCFRIHEKRDCEGALTQMIPITPWHNDFSRYRLDKEMKSGLRCYDECFYLK